MYEPRRWRAPRDPEGQHLRVKESVESIGAGFAFTSQTLCLEFSPGSDPEQFEAAIQTIDRWRKENRGSFAYHEEQFRHERAGTFDYPPYELAGGGFF